MKSKNNNKRIFIISPTESILTKRGNRHPILAQFLVEQGYEIEYLTSDFYHAEKRWFSKKEVEDAQSKAFYKLTVMKCLGYYSNISTRRVVSNFLLSLKFFIYLLQRINNKNVLVLPSRPVEMIFFAALLRLIKKNSVALDIRDIWPDMLITDDWLKKTLFTMYCNAFLYPSLRFIDKFIHVAPSFIKWLNRYAPKATSSFIPLGYDQHRWELNNATDEKRDGTINLVCVGMLQYQIDIMPILKAILNRSEYHLTLIGDNGEGERYPEVINYIDTNEMRNVTIVGRVMPELMVSYLKKMDIGVVPMISNSIPNKVFDYIGSYLPIIALGENDITELLSKYNIGWGVSFNEEDVSKFLDLLTYEDIIEKKNNINLVRDRFCRDKLHYQILEVIEK